MTGSGFLATRVESIPITTTRSRSAWRRFSYLPYALALPILLYEFIFIMYPIYEGIRSSFTKQTVGKPAVWVGLGNYRHLMHDANFWNSVRQTIFYMLS